MATSTEDEAVILVEILTIFKLAIYQPDISNKDRETKTDNSNSIQKEANTITIE